MQAQGKNLLSSDGAHHRPGCRHLPARDLRPLMERPVHHHWEPLSDYSARSNWALAGHRHRYSSVAEHDKWERHTRRRYSSARLDDSSARSNSVSTGRHRCSSVRDYGNWVPHTRRRYSSEPAAARSEG